MDGWKAVTIRRITRKNTAVFRRLWLSWPVAAAVVVASVATTTISRATAAIPPPSELNDAIGGPELNAAVAPPLDRIGAIGAQANNVGPAVPEAPVSRPPELPTANLNINEPREMPLAETGPSNSLPHPPGSVGMERSARGKQTEPPPSGAKPGNASENVAPTRSERMEQISRQADEQIRHGFELANRGAYYAARASFLAALRLVAEALDTERKSNDHGRALAAALTAMKEVEDFLPNGAGIETSLELKRIIAAHSTPVLKKTDDVLTSMVATQRYFTYAQEQFSDAADREVAGSMALYALGKLHGALAQKKSSLEVAAESKAIVYYQAALLSCPKNHMAANDLGVLLARYGRYQEARQMLEFSVACQRLSVTWHNLSVVYQQLGQPSLARNANHQALALEQNEATRRRAVTGSASGTVRWVDPQAFAASGINSPTAPYAYSRPPVQAARPSAEPGRLPTDARTATAIGAASSPRPASRSPFRYGSPPSSAERMTWGNSTYQR